MRSCIVAFASPCWIRITCVCVLTSQTAYDDVINDLTLSLPHTDLPQFQHWLEMPESVKRWDSGGLTGSLYSRSHPQSPRPLPKRKTNGLWWRDCWTGQFSVRPVNERGGIGWWFLVEWHYALPVSCLYSLRAGRALRCSVRTDPTAPLPPKRHQRLRLRSRGGLGGGAPHWPRPPQRLCWSTNDRPCK